jgi:hypothetical protein
LWSSPLSSFYFGVITKTVETEKNEKKTDERNNVIILQAALLKLMAVEHFTRTIRTQEGNLNFYFNRIFTAQGFRYHVSVLLKNKNIIAFRMQKENNRWYIDNPKDCPEWIVSLEPLFSDVIIENLIA